MEKTEQVVERSIQRRMGRILFWGMAVCAAIIIAGGVLYLAQKSGASAHFDHFTSSVNQPRTIHALLRGVRNLNGGALIAAGTLLLVLLQYVRVAMSALMFGRLKAWFFVGISVFILGVLVVALIV